MQKFRVEDEKPIAGRILGYNGTDTHYCKQARESGLDYYGNRRDLFTGPLP